MDLKTRLDHKNIWLIPPYEELIKTLQPLGKKLHLMFSIGKDQIRGAYTHKEIIEIVYQCFAWQ
ncbi:MAG: hypothetical protein LC660_18325 [Desulfobacteraceae bacterium]|nr:hypothetical protein [Desulfobacteraceae bacterium]